MCDAVRLGSGMILAILTDVFIFLLLLSISQVIFALVFSESLIRTAFQCLQLVVTDFLPTMPCTCLQIVVDVAGSFGLQNQELNISLTSIGLLVRVLLPSTTFIH